VTAERRKENIEVVKARIANKIGLQFSQAESYIPEGILGGLRPERPAMPPPYHSVDVTEIMDMHIASVVKLGNP
jgi:hypothetical protein